jgi:plastocyanin
VHVRFVGPAPARTKLNRQADPYCAKTEALSEEVIVNPNGTLANTAVYIKKVRGKFDIPKEAVKLSQNGCMYTPHVQTAMKGQSVEITNGDKTLHNVHSYKGVKKKNWFNVAQPPGAPAKLAKLKKAEISTFKCDVHPWMASYVITTDHPFSGVTSEDGSVTLANVPSKSKPYEIIIWHEKYGQQTAAVVVKPGRTSEVSFSYRGS